MFVCFLTLVWNTRRLLCDLILRGGPVLLILRGDFLRVCRKRTPQDSRRALGGSRELPAERAQGRARRLTLGAHGGQAAFLPKFSPCLGPALWMPGGSGFERVRSCGGHTRGRGLGAAGQGGVQSLAGLVRISGDSEIAGFAPWSCSCPAVVQPDSPGFPCQC